MVTRIDRPASCQVDLKPQVANVIKKKKTQRCETRPFSSIVACPQHPIFGIFKGLDDKPVVSIFFGAKRAQR
jgi:hypothetical protein